MKIVEGNLVLKEDTVFDESIEVRGNIVCEGGPWDIKAWHIKAWNITSGNIKAWHIKAWNITSGNINAWNITAWDITARDIKAWNITSGNIKARNISFWGLLFAYYSIKCKSAVSSRTKHAIVCLDGEVSYNED